MALAYFQIYQGASKTFKATLTDEDGDAINLTGQTSMQLRAINRLSGVEVFDLALILDGAATLGKVQRLFVPEDTEQVSAGIYNAQIMILLGGGVQYFSPVLLIEIGKNTHEPII